MFGATKTENEAYYYAWSIISYIIDEYGKEKANEIFAKYKPKAE